MIYHAMMLCWKIDDALPWFLGWPFCWLGDRLEDYGLATGRIKFKDEIIERCKAASAQYKKEGSV